MLRVSPAPFTIGAHQVSFFGDIGADDGHDGICGRICNVEGADLAGIRDRPIHPPPKSKAGRERNSMSALVAALVPIIVIIVIALIIIWVAERFSPDPLITKIIQVVVFAVVLIALLMKLVPMLGLR